MFTIYLISAFLAFAEPEPITTNWKTSELNENIVSILGSVKTTGGEPVAFANILVKGTVKGAFTNLDGSFQLFNLENGNCEVQISAVGFKTVTKYLTVVDGQIQKLEVVFEEEGVEMPQFAIIADKDRIFSKVPGSVAFIDQETIKNLKPISGNEILRRVPGLHVVDEEGLGMRVNIGIRGLYPDRSRSVLMLEDGVPVALAPYGEPEMYYTPAIDRMAGVEILKGSGQILYGPQTIGGVVN